MSSTESAKPRNVIAPLPPGFQAPWQCSKPYVVRQDVSNAGLYNGIYSEVWTVFSNLPKDHALSGECSYGPCLPSATDAAGAFYSPATNCPSGWDGVATEYQGLSAVDFVHGIDRSTLLPSETAVVCCPSGFIHAPAAHEQATGSCYLNVREGAAAYVSCSAGRRLVRLTRTGVGFPTDVTVTATGAPGTPTTAEVPFTAIKIVAPTVQINLRPDGPKESDSSDSRDSLSPGRIALIVVPTVAGLVFLFIAFKIIKRHRARKRSRGPADGYHKPELDASGVRPSELEDTERHELEACSAPLELSGDVAGQAGRQ